MKRLSFVLLVFLIVSLVSPLYRVSAQEDTFYVSVECSKLYGLRGEAVDISTFTNASSFRLEIISPSEAVLYNQTRISNMTLTVPIDAEYGTYTVHSVVEGSDATTWFTVLDVSNWTLASFPYEVFHDGCVYTFYANWTLTVALYDEVLTVDLAKLREWKDAFNLDVTALKNSMNFLVRFSKGSYFALDLTFAFIHSGCKIVVNGTQDQVRDFTFSFNAKAFKNRLDGISSSHIIFDWSDIPKTAYEYDGENKLLTVHIPESFRVDPYIFEDGFESNDFTAWTAKLGSSETSSTQVHHGDYACYCDARGEGCYKTFTQVTNAYARFYIYITQWGSGEQILGRMFRNGWGSCCTAEIELTNHYWQLYVNQPSETLTGDVAASLNTWYAVQLRWTKNTVGGAEMWVYDNSGSEVEHLTCTVRTNNYKCDRFDIFSSDTNFGTPKAYYDCAVIDSSPIGPEEAGEGQNLYFYPTETLVITDSLTTLKALQVTQSGTCIITEYSYGNKAMMFVEIETGKITDYLIVNKALMITATELIFITEYLDSSKEVAITMMEVVNTETLRITNSFTIVKEIGINILEQVSERLCISSTVQTIKQIAEELTLSLVFGVAGLALILVFVVLALVIAKRRED